MDLPFHFPWAAVGSVCRGLGPLALLSWPSPPPGSENAAHGSCVMRRVFCCRWSWRVRPPVDAPAALPPAQLHVPRFGDSLTAGKDLSDPDCTSYPAVLERRLGKGFRVRVTNAGQSGTRVSTRARVWIIASETGRTW